MSVIYLILPLAILLGIIFVAAFIWAARTGQFDDTESPPMRMLNDEDDEGA